LIYFYSIGRLPYNTQPESAGGLGGLILEFFLLSGFAWKGWRAPHVRFKIRVFLLIDTTFWSSLVLYHPAQPLGVTSRRASSIRHSGTCLNVTVP